MKHLMDWIFVAAMLSALVDNFRLRRRLRVDRLAQEAEDALGPPHIGDIVMPDPSDPRWKFSEWGFLVNGTSKKEQVLVLESIAVSRDGDVYIGPGLPVSGGRKYGNRVLHAYKRRLAEQSRGSTS